MIYSADRRFWEFEGLGEMKLPEKFNEKLIDDFSNKGPGKLIFLIPEELLYETFVLSKFPKYILREYAMIKLDDDNKLGIEQYNLIKFREDIELYEESDNKDEIVARTRQVIVDGIKDKNLDRQVIEKNFAIYFHSQIISEWIRSKYEYWYNENKAIIKLQPSQLKLDIILNRNEDVFLRGPVEAICEYRKSTPIRETVDAILWNDKVKNLTPDYDEESDDYGTEEYLDYKLTLTSDRLTRIFKILDNNDVTKEDLNKEIIEFNMDKIWDRLSICINNNGNWDITYGNIDTLNDLYNMIIKIEVNTTGEIIEMIDDDMETWFKIERNKLRQGGIIEPIIKLPELEVTDFEILRNLVSDYIEDYITQELDGIVISALAQIRDADVIYSETIKRILENLKDVNPKSIWKVIETERGNHG